MLPSGCFGRDHVKAFIAGRLKNSNLILPKQRKANAKCPVLTKHCLKENYKTLFEVVIALTTFNYALSL